METVRLLAIAVFLAACGGGGGGVATPLPPPPGKILIIDGECGTADAIYYADPVATAPTNFGKHGSITIPFARTFTNDRIDCYLAWINGNSGQVDLVSGTRFAADNGYRAVTYAWAIGIIAANNPQIQQAIDYAAANGVRVYAGAGNDGKQLTFPNDSNLFIVGSNLPLSNYGTPVDLIVGHRSTSFATVQAAAQGL